MLYPTDIGFNPSPPGLMHLDLNSCFASIEQQANPHYRHRPLVVAAYNLPSACIIAASIEAKQIGIKVGFRVKDALAIFPKLIVLEPDPDKYRHVHHSFSQLLSAYSSSVHPKSIDEFVVKFDPGLNLPAIATEIKQKIKRQIGDYLTVSVGIGPNRFLAKTASNLHKPDGLDVINIHNFDSVYRQLKLTDLCGLKQRSAIRLNQSGIITLADFYRSPVWQLKSAFHSILGYYWYLRLRGWEIDEFTSHHGSYSQSYVLGRPVNDFPLAFPSLQKLIEKMSFRLRQDGYQSRGINLVLVYVDHSFWHHSATFSESLFESRDFFQRFLRLLYRSPPGRPIKQIAINCFHLSSLRSLQLDLFGSVNKKYQLAKSLDKISRRWGRFVVTPANMVNSGPIVPDRIAFGNIK